MRTALPKIIAGCLIAASGLVATGAQASAANPTGNEVITSPTSPYTPALTSTNNPDKTKFVITGTGYAPGANIFAIVCDGKPLTAPGWAVTSDCDNLTQPASVAVQADGSIAFNSPTNANFQVGLFRGESPNDDFNCLASDDNPNGPTTSDGSGDQVDPTVASWGSSQGGSESGGGTAPCQVLVYYQGNLGGFTPSDLSIAIALAGGTAAAPTVTSVSPSSLRAGAQTTLTINGTGFTPSTVVTFSGMGVKATVKTESPTKLTVAATVSATATPGARTVTATEGGTTATCTNCFTVKSAPKLTKATPSTVTAGTTTKVTFAATGAETGVALTFIGPSSGITASVTSVTSTAIVANVKVASTTTPGAFKVKLTNPDKSTASCSGCLTVKS